MKKGCNQQGLLEEAIHVIPSTQFMNLGTKTITKIFFCKTLKPSDWLGLNCLPRLCWLLLNVVTVTF